MKSPKLTNTIKGAIKREGYSGLSFSKMIGLPYRTLVYRFKNPATWRFCEWGAVERCVTFNDSEREIIRKEIEKL